MPLPSLATPALQKLADPAVDGATLILAEKDRWQQLLQQHRTTRRHRELQELLLDPLPQLTQAFAEGLIRKSKKHPIVLVLDTYEKASPDINTWLCHYLLANTDLRHHKIRLVIAGRYSLLKLEGWRRLHQNLQIIYENSLSRFNQQQTQTYLTQLNIHQGIQIQAAHRTTKGLPYYLNWLREQKERGIEIDFSQGHDEISRVLLQGLNSNQRKVVQLAACCRWFDRIVLQHLIHKQTRSLDFRTAVDEKLNCFEWLIQRDFVKIVQFRYCLDDVARDVFRLSLRQEDPDFFHQTHTLLADYFEQRASQLVSPNSSLEEQLENTDWRAYTVEMVYHQFFSQPSDQQRQFLTNLTTVSPLSQSEVLQIAFTAIAAEADVAEHPLMPHEARKALTVIGNTIISGSTQGSSPTTLSQHE